MKRLLCIFLLCVAAVLGGTTTYQITASADLFAMVGDTYDNSVVYTNAQIAPGAYGSYFIIGWRKRNGYNHYQSNIGLLRYHTNGIGAPTAASIQWPASYFSWTGSMTGCKLKGSYYTGTWSESAVWPTNSADGNDAFGPIDLDTAAPAAGSSTALSTLSSINRSGDTIIRVYIDCGVPYGYAASDVDLAYQKYFMFGMLGTSASNGAYWPQLVVTTNSAPTTNSVSGIPGNCHYGTWQTVSAAVSDPDGFGDLQYWHLLINYGVAGGYSCYFLLYPNSNTFYLMNDAENSWQAGCTMGAACTTSNSQCKVDASGSYFTNSGTSSTVTLKVMFLPGALVRNPMNAYLYAVDNSNVAVGWNGPYQTGYVRTRPKLIVRN